MEKKTKNKNQLIRELIREVPKIYKILLLLNLEYFIRNYYFKLRYAFNLELKLQSKNEGQLLFFLIDFDKKK